MFRIWGSKPELKVRVPQRSVPDILVNDVDGEAKEGVIDYTEEPANFLIDLRNKFQLEEPWSKENPIVKIRSRFSSLKINKYESLGNYSLNYNGFLLIDEHFPLYISHHSFKLSREHANLEEHMLESGKTTPLTLIGRLNKSDKGLHPYNFYPFVIRLGEYTFPPRRN